MDIAKIVGIYSDCTIYIVGTYTITVDETISVEKIVKMGNFNWSNKNITSNNFPKPINGQRSKKEITLFQIESPGCLASSPSEIVIQEISAINYKPTNIWELISLVIEEPDLQRKFPIIAPGSVCNINGYNRIPCLWKNDLGLGLFRLTWCQNCLYAGVHK